MLRRLLALTLTTFLIAGAAPAWADDDPGDEATSIESSEEDNSRTHGGRVAAILARYFGSEEDAALLDEGEETAGLTEILDLHALGFGYGEIFKLELLAQAMETDMKALLEEICGVEPDGETCELDWGEWRQTYEDELAALGEDAPRNLGRLVSASSKNQGQSGPPEHAATQGQKRGH